MAIALGAQGTVATAATNSITPAFGRTTVAGSLLVACVGGNSSGVSTTPPTGWTYLNSSSFAVMFMKANCVAGETAPTFSASSGVTSMWAQLTEWTGCATSPADQQCTGGGLGSSTTSNTAPDTNASDLAVYFEMVICTKSATCTISTTWTSPTGGTVVNLGNTGSTKATVFFHSVALLIAGNGGVSADSVSNTYTPSTGTATNNGNLLQSFLPVVPFNARPVVVSQAVNRAAVYFSRIPWKERRSGLTVPGVI